MADDHALADRPAQRRLRRGPAALYVRLYDRIPGMVRQPAAPAGFRFCARIPFGAPVPGGGGTERAKRAGAGALLRLPVPARVQALALMRFVILNHSYDQFLKWLYDSEPDLTQKNFTTQIDTYYQTLFGSSDFWTHMLRALGHEVDEFVCNNTAEQAA